MRLLAIDPGNVESAWVLFDKYLSFTHFGIWHNSRLLGLSTGDVDHIAIEYMRPRGMKMSQQSMDTMFWAGRIIERLTDSETIPWTPVDRHQVKLHICGQAKAKDSNIRQAIIDDWYGGETAAIGNKKCRKCKGKGTYKRETCSECEGCGWLHPPGPLVGIHDDLWSAIAVGVTFLENMTHTPDVPASHATSARRK